jgi:hypothetical protein
MQTTGIAAMTLSTINFSALVPSFTAVNLAAAPVTAPMLAIVAAGALLAGLFVADIGGFRSATVGAFDAVVGAGEAAVDFITAAPGRITDAFLSYHPAGIMIDHRDEIIDAVADLPDELFESGQAAIDEFVSGIQSMADAPVEAVEDIVGGVRDRLPFSPAEVGPLSDLDEAGEALPETLATHAERNAGRAAEAGETVARAADPRPQGDSGGGETTVTLAFDSSARDLESVLWEALEPHIREVVDEQPQDGFSSTGRI